MRPALHLLTLLLRVPYSSPHAHNDGFGIQNVRLLLTATADFPHPEIRPGSATFRGGESSHARC